MKLAHYMHIAPRLLFVAQGLATLIGAIVQCGVTVFMITRIEGVCTPEAAGNFICPHGQVTYSSSLIWGEIDSLSASSQVMANLPQALLVQADCFPPGRYTAIYFGFSSLDPPR
jgi:hypothetical protein